ncbi:carboxypeptidase regulatory-like domain-containing protein [Thermococcus sp. Bubb.Bath]|nr:carboxypeptidase regulatory-like domain-containing protein [Thermococcus sp. Bubb.Bath]
MPALPTTGSASADQPGLPFILQPLQDNIEVLPGSALTIPVRVTNLLNESLENMSVVLKWAAGGGLYVVNKTTPIGPHESRVFDLTLRVPMVPSGTYNLTVLGLWGNFTVEKNMTVTVKPYVEYTMDAEVGYSYIYGHDVLMNFSIVSYSNDVLTGPIWVKVYRNNTLVDQHAEIYPLQPGGTWKYSIKLEKPKTGIYTVLFSANLSGIYREVKKTFVVYRRRFNYTVWYSDGALRVRVLLSNGSPAAGVPVSFDGIKLETNGEGLAVYPTTEPRTYNVTLNLDGIIKKIPVTVGQLRLNTTVSGGNLVIRVVDSSGNPVPNVTLSITASRGEYTAITGEDGTAKLSVDALGYGPVSISATAVGYVGATATLAITSMWSPITTTGSTYKTTTSSSSTTTPLTSSTLPTTTTPIPPSTPKGSSLPAEALVLGVSAAILVGGIYLSFFRPHIIEEELGRYYFVKLKAPRLVPLKDFHWEGQMNAVEVRATEGDARIEGNTVIWEIEEMKPGEEAVLQVVLG